MLGRWARWHYVTAPETLRPRHEWGRWHVVARIGIDERTRLPAVRLACGRSRFTPDVIREQRPPDDLCPECVGLDDLRRKYDAVKHVAKRMAIR